MPNANPYEAGDDIFQQFDLTRTKPIKAGTSIVKGAVYTTDDDGYIVAATATGGVANLTKGIFQAKTTLAAVAGESDGDRTVQFLVAGAFMIFKAPADIVEGQTVGLAATLTTVDPDKVEANAAVNLGSLGRVYQILTVDSDEEAIIKTVNDNLVIVQTGVL